MENEMELNSQRNSEDNLECNKKNTFYEFSKRTLDIMGAVTGIILLSPVLIIVGIMIKMDDPKGGIVFSQDRIGLKGKKFKMYKLRSMVHNAEEL